MPRSAPLTLLSTAVAIGITAWSSPCSHADDARADDERRQSKTIARAPASAVEAPLRDAIEHARRITVRVGDPSGASGSGTLVSHEGHVLTALHVVEGLPRLRVTLPDGTVHRARVVSRDAERDLALLTTDARATPCVPRAPLSDDDAWVLAAGFAGALAGLTSPSITVGFALGDEPMPDDSADDARPRTLASLHVAPGMSGGPVLDRAGALRGIVVAMARFRTIHDAPLLDAIACGALAPAPTSSTIATATNEHHEPDRDASLAVALAPIDPALREHVVELRIPFAGSIFGVVVADERVLTLADRHLADARTAADEGVEILATEDELALVRVHGLRARPLAIGSRAALSHGEIVRGLMGAAPGIVGAIEQGPGLLRPFVPTPPGRHCGTLLNMRRAAAPDVLLAHPVVAHDAALTRGELLLDATGRPRAIHVGHHVAGLGYAVDLEDAIARFASALLE